MEKRKSARERFLALLRDEADERAHACLAIHDGPMPHGGFPGVVCAHGTLNLSARRTLGLPPEPGDPREDKRGVDGKDYARQLVRRGYVTVSPEHSCAAAPRPLLERFAPNDGEPLAAHGPRPDTRS